MDVNWGHMTEQMLNFTLEIIYLLTGEDYILVKTTGLYVISRNHPSGFGKFLANQSSKMVPPSPPLISEKDNKQKVLEVTNKIIELLTGEVPIRCQDVTVYFSMEEWEYLEGHKDLYKDTMLASQPTIISPDGFSNGNPPERCPHPMYSQDSTQEDLANPKQHHIEDEDVITVKAEAYDEQEEPCEEEEEDALLEINTDGSTTINSPDICPHPLYSQDSTKEDLTVPHHHQGEDVITIKAEAYDEEEEPDVRDEESCEEEEAILEINTDGSTTINPPERCPHPLYSREHQEIPHHHQFEDDGEEEVYMTAYEQCKEECPIEMNGEGLDVRRTLKGHLALSPYWDREDDRIAEASLGEDQIIPPFRPGLNRLSSNFQESFLDNSLSLISDHHLGLHSADRTLGPANAEDTIHRKALRGNKLHLCPFCGKQFTTHANVVRHVRTHTGDRPYSCSLCGKSFTQKSILLNHQTVHTGDRPFPCPDCGKCFAKSSDVIRHRRVHTGERPYLCLECGKTFTQKFRLRNHQRFHNEEKLSLLGLASISNQFR